MRAAPGFGAVRWDAAETVEVTTLDALIAAHGVPRFVKIDVEGFEAEVLAGLAAGAPGSPSSTCRPRPRPPPPASTRLAALGRLAFNLVPGEAAAFALDRWLDADAIGARAARRRRRGRPATSTPGCAAAMR